MFTTTYMDEKTTYKSVSQSWEGRRGGEGKGARGVGVRQS